MKQDKDYFYWNKGDNVNLSPYFSTKEFSCQCKHPDCIEQRVSKELIRRITEIRKEVKKPTRVTSGFRCQKHQEDIRRSGRSTVVAKKKSTHELGHAADIMVDTWSISDLLVICAKYFKSIGIAKNFLHLDLRDDMVRRWDY